MREYGSVTNLIHKLQAGDEDASIGVYNYFIDRARRMAKGRLANWLKGSTTPSTIAHEALGNSILLARGVDNMQSREDFRRMISWQIRIRLQNAANRALASKRDVSRNVPSSAAKELEDNSPPPDADLLFDELVEQFVNIIFKEKNETKRAIATLSILGDCTVSEIQEKLFPARTSNKKINGGKKEPSSKSYIGLVIAESRRRLRRELEQEDGE